MFGRPDGKSRFLAAGELIPARRKGLRAYRRTVEMSKPFLFRTGKSFAAQYFCAFRRLNFQA